MLGRQETLSPVREIHFVLLILIEAVHTSEKPLNFYETTRYNVPPGCHLSSL
jgi:hypothetical protein